LPILAVGQATGKRGWGRIHQAGGRKILNADPASIIPGDLMSKLFEATKLNGMSLKNRFIRSATAEGMATEEGEATPRLINLMAELAEGGVGLIITGHTYVAKRGQATPWQLGIYDDQLITGLRRMADAVHQRDGRIVMQLAHSGILANPRLTGDAPLGPSAIEGLNEVVAQEMTIEDIQGVVEAFGNAAERAREAGFDGVQIHAAHSYLLSQFLSPAFNVRNDAYGGPIENRARFLLDVVQTIRKRVGDNYPLLVKLNARDFLEGGLELEDSIKAGTMLKEAGIDAIEISGGAFASGDLTPSRKGITTEADEAYFKAEARAFKERIDLPIILVGGIRSLTVAESIVGDHITDYISMSRPFIREPGLINRWQSGDRYKATCVSDSKCFRPALSGRGVYCVVEKRLQDQKKSGNQEKDHPVTRSGTPDR
jgi:2,4-dienoyl-CoA reductase-like NADH-dependent reductase (Old Yellow Enzyme family)